MKVKFSIPKTESFLGENVKTVAAYVGNQYSMKVLCLVGEDTPYMPIGGRKVLKEILNTCEEGVTYYWKQLNY